MNVELGAIDVGLRKTLDASGARLKAWGASLISVGKQMAALGGAATAAFAAAGVSFATAGGDLDRMARRLGISVESLQEFGFAARQTGSDVDAAAAGIANMNRLLVEAALGSVDAQKAFATIGEDWEELKDLSPEDAFLRVARAMEKYSANARVLPEAVKAVFGDERLIGLMAEGAAGLEKYRKQARDLGIVMDAEAARGGLRLEQALKGLKDQAGAVGNTIGSAVAPAMRQLGEALGPLVKSTIDWLRENKETVATVAKVAVAVTGAGFALIGLGFILKGVGVALGVVSIAFKALMITQIASAIKWGVWTAAVVIAKGAVLAWSAATIIAKTAVLAWKAACVALEGAMAGISAAMSLMNIVQLAVNMASLAVAVGAVVVVTGLLTAAVGGMWAAIKAAMGAIAGADFGKAFANFKAPLKEWLGLLGDITRAMSVDMNLAWELAVAAAELAVAQMREIWPPLWAYIQAGFSLLWRVMQAGFKAGFFATLTDFKRGFLQTFEAIAKVMPTFAPAVEGLVSIFNLPAEEEAVAGMQREVEDLKHALKEALSTPIEFDLGTEAAKAAQAKVDAIRARLAQAQKEQSQARAKDEQERGKEAAAKKAGKVPGALKAVFQQVDVVGTFTGALAGRLGGTTVNQLLKQQVDYLAAIAGNTAKPNPVFGAD